MRELAGFTETLRSPESKALEWHQTAMECFEESLALFNSDDYSTKNGWKKEEEDSKTGDIIYSRSMKDGKLFCIRIELAIDQELFFNDLIQSIDTEYQHNPNFEFSQRVTWLGEKSDIAHVILKEHLMVKSRDLVTARVWRKLDDSLMIAGRSIDCHLLPPQKNRVRAELKFATARFTPSSEKAGHCIMEYLTQGDLKGWLPKSVIDAVMSKFLLQDVVIQRNRVERLLNSKEQAEN
uniref:START domain-containing protein n=1 Tax=Plectus sambesii TaxID=2011161 RepID=A0A914VZR0_9BILA